MAISSGISKVLLMPQEVACFGQYGINNTLLVAFGVLQIVGGALLAAPKTRIAGSALVALTFIVSAIILMLSGDIPMALVTLFFTMLLGFIAKFNARISFKPNT